MNVTVEKAVCPECGKHIMHLKAHMKRNHPVVKPKEAVPDLTIDLLAPSPEQLSIPAPVEKPIVAPEPELPEPVALPPTPPPTPKARPSFAAVAASNSSSSSAFTAVLPYKLPKRLSPLTLPSITGERALDLDRLMKNVLKHWIPAAPGRKSEWALLCHLWESAPGRFQIKKQHISAGNPNPRVTVTIYRDHKCISYSQYHIYMDPSAFAQVLYIEGLDSGESYRLIEFFGKEATA